MHCTYSECLCDVATIELACTGFLEVSALSAGPLLVLLIVFSFTKRQIDSFQNWRSSFHNKNAGNLTSGTALGNTFASVSILALMFMVVFIRSYLVTLFSMQRHFTEN